MLNMPERKGGAVNRCPDARALLPAYVENELTSVEFTRMKGHLDICSACRREEMAFRSALGALQAAPKPVHGDLYAGLAARLDRLERRPVYRPAKLRWAGGLACLILAAGVGATVVARTLFPAIPEQPAPVLVQAPPPKDPEKVAQNNVTPAPASSEKVKDPFEAVGTDPKQNQDPVYDPGEPRYYTADPEKPPRQEKLQRQRASRQRDDSWRYANDIRKVRAANGDTVEDIMNRLKRDGRAFVQKDPVLPDGGGSTKPAETETPKDLPVRTVIDPHLPDVAVIAPEREMREKFGEKIVKSSRAEGFDRTGRLTLIRINAEAAPAPQEKSPVRRGSTEDDN
jgi:hypothetical protein